MLSELGPPPDKRPLFYVCGPTPFVENVADLLVGLGHPADRVRTERFGPTGAQIEAGELHLDGNGVAGAYQGSGIVLRCPHCGDISALLGVMGDHGHLLELRGRWLLGRPT
jgi:ferredoxin-NADP reductase